MAKTASLFPSLLAVAAFGGLAGCTSTDSTMGLLPPTPLAGVPANPGDTPARTAAAPSRQSIGEIQFLPVIGAPPEKAVQLAEALSRNAASNGIDIRSSQEPAAPLRLKGYLSAVNDGSRTVVIYVWDVLDRTDTRINRIQGQETIPGAVADPWSAVGPATLDAIAARTMQEAARLSASLA